MTIAELFCVYFNLVIAPNFAFDDWNVEYEMWRVALCG